LVFHGAKDKIVPCLYSVELFEKLQNLGENVKLTIYPEVEHVSWTETYNNRAFYEWMFMQEKNEKKIQEYFNFKLYETIKNHFFNSVFNFLQL